MYTHVYTYLYLYVYIYIYKYKSHLKGQNQSTVWGMSWVRIYAYKIHRINQRVKAPTANHTLFSLLGFLH